MFKLIITVFGLGVGVGILGAHCHRKHRTAPKREAKTQPFDPRYVEKHGDKARSRDYSFERETSAARTTQAELPA